MKAAVIGLYTQITDNIYSIYVELPNSPLKNLNAYLIKGKDRNLLIDTGERRRRCRESLLSGLHELGVRMEETDIFLTHMHTDHVGLVPEIATPETRVYMSGEDIRRQLDTYDPNMNKRTYIRQRKNGFSDEQIANSPFLRPEGYAAEGYKDYIPVEEGHVFEYGGHRLRTILTPGHSPGHMCLYDDENRIVVIGDHVLFDITPNISPILGVPDSLGDYIQSLLKVRDLDVDIVLPGHRGVSCSMAERIDQLIEHHGERVREAVEALDRHPGSTAYQLAGNVSWNIRYDGNWENFPVGQQAFAVNEMRAHLEYLLTRGRASREEVDGVEYYYPPER